MANLGHFASAFSPYYRLSVYCYRMSAYRQRPSRTPLIAPLRSATRFPLRGALRAMFSLSYPPSQKLVREEGGIVKGRFLSKQTHGGPGSNPWADSA